MDYAERFPRLTIYVQTKETYFFPIFTFFTKDSRVYKQTMNMKEPSINQIPWWFFSVSDEGDQEMK